MDTLIAYAHDVPALVRRRLRLDCWAEIRPASWKHCWSYEVTQGEKGAWDLEAWAGRFYVVLSRLPRQGTGNHLGIHG